MTTPKMCRSSVLPPCGTCCVCIVRQHLQQRLLTLLLGHDSTTANRLLTQERDVIVKAILDIV